MSTANDLLIKIERNEALIGVIGLGYVGLPLCLAFGEANAKVLGFDVDATKVDAIMAGQTYLKQYKTERIAALVENGRLSATADMGRLSEPDIIIICVPTPLTKYLEPDLSFVEQTTETIAASLRPGQLVILESTTYPGTTRDVVKTILERGDLKSGEEFWLAFSPEREDPGNEKYTTASIPKVVGADDENGCRLAAATYSIFADHVIPVSSSSTAEAVKITENIFRAVNIALVNELKVIYSEMGINIWDVIEAAKTKPFGFMPFYPGPGLGGHCIPIDPFYLTWKAREYGLSTRFIELAGQINTAMPDYVLSVLIETLSERFATALNGARILVVGVAYKKNVDDMRESPALELIEKLTEKGADVDYYDPYFPVIPMTREHESLAGRQSIDWSLEGVSGYDAVLVATDHDGIDYVGMCGTARLIIDTRNACARAGADLDVVVGA